MKKGCLLAALLPLAIVLIQFSCIQLNLYRGDQTKRALLEALKQRYPQTRFAVGNSYEAPRVYLSVYDVTHPSKQAEMRDWLAAWKAQHQTTVEIWLEFYLPGNQGDPAERLKL
jgi:hypothetical protein